jgi:predicted nucleic acid-binding protein
VIFLDTNVISETMRLRPNPAVVDWLIRHDAELALSSVVIAEIAFGINKLPPDQRAHRLAAGLDAWRQRFAGRVFAFTEECALTYGTLMGAAARRGRSMSAQDGMVAAIAITHGSKLATRNTANFDGTSVELVNPWS